MEDTVEPQVHYGLTKRQAELLDFVKAHTKKYGYCPSYEDLLEATGLKSKSGIHRTVLALEKRGKIVRLPYRARSLRVVE